MSWFDSNPRLQFSIRMSSPTRTIAIIGGGLGGTLVAVQLLLRAQAGTRIVLVERKIPAGRGVAYGTICYQHLLNVPAARMSAFPDQPEHFLQWVSARTGQLGFPDQVAAGDFMPRSIYGDYIVDVLQQVRTKKAREVEFESVTGEAVDLEESAGGALITLRDGRKLEAGRVVLAVGNLPGEYPVRRPLPFYHGPRYVHLPWTQGALENIRKHDDVLLVGAGLTAVDMMVQLDQLGHRGVIHALSRRGLQPQSHKAGLKPYPPFLSDEPLPATARGALHRVRTEVKKAVAAGHDWRVVIDAIRPQSQALWQGFSWEQRALFLRHVRPHWEVHRHRIAPHVAAIVSRLEAEGRVKFYAGRLHVLRDIEGGAEAVFLRRGSGERIALQVAKVINCTGPRSDYSKYQHPLLVNLLARGLIDHDPLALGINALPTGEVLRYKAGPMGWLFTLGAPLKGVLWESTAAPEIRTQAQALSLRLLS